MENLRPVSKVKVWCAPILTWFDSPTFWPDRRILIETGSKSTFETRMVRLSLFFSDEVDPVDVVLMTLRRVVHRTRSVGGWRRLYACHRSSGVSAIRRMFPDPSFEDVFFCISFILKYDTCLSLVEIPDICCTLLKFWQHCLVSCVKIESLYYFAIMLTTVPTGYIL